MFFKRREFEEKVAQKYDELKRGYSNSLSTDHEAGEIESKMSYSGDFLKRKGSTLCYDFSADEDTVEKEFPKPNGSWRIHCGSSKWYPFRVLRF